MFAFSTLFITPGIACYAYFAGMQSTSGDWLNMLSWSNLSTKEAKVYWLYTLLVPLTVILILYMISRQLARGVMICQKALNPHNANHCVSPRNFFVAVKSLPSDWDTDKIRRYYSRWKDHIVFTDFVRQSHPRLVQLGKLVQRIEKSETLFILDMVRTFSTMDTVQFQRHVLQKIQQRYSRSADKEKKSLINGTATMPTLYERLRGLAAAVPNQTNQPKRSGSVRSALLGLSDYYAARAIEDCPQSLDMFRCRAQYLGSNVLDIIPSNICYSWSQTEARRSFVRSLIMVTIVLWTIPMAAVGSLSQISILLQIIPGGSDVGIPDWLRGVVQGVAPSLATSILMSLYPLLLRFTLKHAKYLTLSEIQIETQKYYTIFLFIQLFVTPSIASGLIPTAFEVLNKGITELPRILALNLPLSGNYYLSYMLIQSILLAAFTIFRLQPLIKLCWRSRQTMTPRQRLFAKNDLLFPTYWGEIYPFYSILAGIGE
ncbi:hypothetical protein H2198_007234 [Neophaeococcomyces mojaviensis]|uniref:Uncharacterized protein n=1 Tax=Neophaeococcomyces mojaviensis TaxID=3383035 RepID=A0ACC3A123_9EURO|nr:hypothetical protein H2198_007234 [Knufia sp. JES_112]